MTRERYNGKSGKTAMSPCAVWIHSRFLSHSVASESDTSGKSVWMGRSELSISYRYTV